MTNKHNDTDKAASMSPERTVLRLYELGIEACRKRDKEQVSRVLVSLINMLDFKYADMANAFFDVYNFALEVLESENYEQVQSLFEGLHEAWNEAFEYSKQVN